MKFKTHIGTGSKAKPATLPEAFYTRDEKRVNAIKAGLRRPTERETLQWMLGGPPPADIAAKFEDSDGLHTHVCGFDVKAHGRAGCGHVWRHDGSDVCTHGEAEFERAHTCPNCGRGLWEWKLSADCPDAIENA